MSKETDKDRDRDLYKKVDRYNLVENLEDCLQCGKCVGACPVARLSPSYNSRQIIRDILMGAQDRWLKSEEIWRCFWCANCYTACPADIHFPLLMMQMRFLALEQGYGRKYVFPFKRFAVAAWQDGLTFAPGSDKGRERIKKVRKNIGLSDWPEISQKAREEYNAIFALTGARLLVEGINEEEGEVLNLTYAEGRITFANRKGS